MPGIVTEVVTLPGTEDPAFYIYTSGLIAWQIIADMTNDLLYQSIASTSSDVVCSDLPTASHKSKSDYGKQNTGENIVVNEFS